MPQNYYFCPRYGEGHVTKLTPKLLNTMYKKLLLILALCVCGTVSATDYNLIPKPQSLTEGEGQFTFSATTTLQYEGLGADTIAQFFADKVRLSTGRKLTVVKAKKKAAKRVQADVVDFVIDPGVEGREAYTLTVTPAAITLRAATTDGLFYAMQTLCQLLPADIENQTPMKTADKWHINSVRITDAPRFAYRGVHLDPCRHFLPVASVKKQIDMLATYKINRLHLHLTEDQGWRIEIKKYPRLTEVGARRVEAEGNVHEGYYTQDEIRDIVAYAAARHIEVVPELEIPGHELAAIAAYPELSCRGDSITPRIIWGVEDIVMCPGKEKMFTFLRDVIDEMVPLFPGKYFHIGGDESPRGEWERCDSCQARMKSLGYTRAAQLQDYVIARVAKYLAQKGKTIIGWDEILEGGDLEPSAIVMSWRGEEGGIEAAKKDHKVIMTPGSRGLYFDHYQGDLITEPTAIGGYAPLEKVYSYDPVPQALKEAGRDSCVLGVQANNWSEYITGPALLELRLWPRAVALAEIAWSDPAQKDFRDFCRRLDDDATARLTAHHIQLHIPTPETPGKQSNKLAFTDTRSITLTTTRPLTILYTLDGTTPNPASARYTSPIEVSRSAMLKTAALLPGGTMGPVRTLFLTKATYAPATKLTNPSKGLTLRVWDGDYRLPEQLKGTPTRPEETVSDFSALRRQTNVPADVRNVQNYGATAEGYVHIPEDGVYEFSSTNCQVYIDGNLVIDNSRVYAPRDTRENVELALAKGYHKIKSVFLGGIFGGWPSYWSDGKVSYRQGLGTWQPLNESMLFH